MADPFLEEQYPVKGLYQALAVAAMCLQEEADTRPLISDVVTALEFLSVNNKNSESAHQQDNASASAASPDTYSDSSGEIKSI
jgi:hypothetical protein